MPNHPKHPQHSERKKDTRRTPHVIHRMEKELFNYFMFNLSEASDSQIKEVLENNKVTFLFLLDENNTLTIGIENPFAQINNFLPSNNALKMTLENILEALVNQVYPTVENKLQKKMNEEHLNFEYSPYELEELVKQVIENKKPLTSVNTELVQMVNGLRAAINKEVQLGHPSLIAATDKAAQIGGELEFKGNSWVLSNKSGRYGYSSEVPLDSQESIFANAKGLIVASEILRLKGISNVKIDICYKPKAVSDKTIRLAEQTSRILNTYRQTGKLEVDTPELRELFPDERELGQFSIEIAALATYSKEVQRSLREDQSSTRKP